tara:strand:- start:27 stop:1154 length:1128 start_codon:yes stop_codon:yes gene_type:complete
MPISKYKPLTEQDITTNTFLAHEAIPITGTIGSGTYGNYFTQSQTNNRTYSHGIYVSTYDYPYLSASANHIYDTLAGELSSSATTATVHGTGAIAANRVLTYDSLTAQLAGPGSTGQILAFDRLGAMGAGDAANEMHNWLALDFSRLCQKDGIQKGTFRLQLGVSNAWATPFNRIITIFDTGSVFNGPAGEYSVLYSGNVGTAVGATLQDAQAVGLLYYQQGVAIFQPSASHISGTFSPTVEFTTASVGALGTYWNWPDSLGSASNDIIAHGLSHRIFDITFSNNVEINSTIYRCAINANEFRYSTNPTFTDPDTSGCRGRQGPDGNYTTEILSKTGITKIGLYDAANRLVAVASPSRVIMHGNDEVVFHLRTDH